MAKAKLTLYVDIISPFSYMAYWMSRNSPIFKSVEITYIPILLGGLMKTCDNRAPIQIRNKGTWIEQERLRWSSYFHIPISPQRPPGFPISTLHIQRALCALELTDASRLPVAIDALYKSFWVEGDGTIGKPEVFGRVLAEALGPETATKVMERIGADETKKRLSENTDRAFKSGGFGLPWWECTNTEGKTEWFWGFDHLGMVARFLGLDLDADRERSGADAVRAML